MIFGQRVVIQPWPLSAIAACFPRRDILVVGVQASNFPHKSLVLFLELVDPSFELLYLLFSIVSACRNLLHIYTQWNFQ